MVAYSVDKLDEILKSIPGSRKYIIAYSGGLDSRVLLHSLVEINRDRRNRISAIYVNHGLSPNADDWSHHCSVICDGYGIDFQEAKINGERPKGESPESWARRKRYQVLRDLTGVDDILLTAHHQDDQIETLLLQLFRGAGPRGLSAMPFKRKFGKGWHYRPLLEFSREKLQTYASSQNLSWIEDESNTDTGIDRNYIRHQVVPLIRSKWPGIGNTLSRVARHQSETSELLGQLAVLDLASVQCGHNTRLDSTQLKKLDEPRQKNVIRYWLKELNLPVPDTRVMQQVIRDVLNSKYDAIPCVDWDGAEIRRYREFIYASGPLESHDPDSVLLWKLQEPVNITYGVLTASRGTGYGIRAALCRDDCLEIRYRRGGETIQPAGRGHHYELKKLFQEESIPPWLRDRIPLLYIDGKLAAVPGKWVDVSFYGEDQEDCWQFRWEGWKRF